MAQQYDDKATDAAAGAPAIAPVQGPGVRVLDALLQHGTPDPAKIVALIDAHRGERDAIFAKLHSSLGNAYVQEVVGAMDHLRASVARRELVAGDPSNPSGGYFEASQAAQGARWRTGDGSFTGTADKHGLDARYRLDSDDALHAHVGADKTGTLAWEHGGKPEAELYGSYKGSHDFAAGVRHPSQLGGGTLTTGVEHRMTASGAFDGAVASYRSIDGTTTASGSAGVEHGGFAGSLAATHRLDAHDTISGSIAHDPTGTTASLAGAHDLDHGRVDASVTRATDRTALHLGATSQPRQGLSVAGHLDHVEPDHGHAQTTLGIAERYRSGDVVQGLDLDAGKGDRDFIGVHGSADARIAHDLYAGAFGGYTVESGKQTTAQVGASLTFTPTEKTALTLAGVLDQDGALETRLQLDVFKSRLANVGDLADHKKDALVSLFLSYSHGGQRHMLDDRFGAAQLGTSHDAGSGQVVAGIRIKF